MDLQYKFLYNGFKNNTNFYLWQKSMFFYDNYAFNLSFTRIFYVFFLVKPHFFRCKFYQKQFQKFDFFQTKEDFLFDHILSKSKKVIFYNEKF